MVVAVIMPLAYSSDSFCFLRIQPWDSSHVHHMWFGCRNCTHVSTSLFQSPFQETSPPALSLANLYTVLHQFHPHEGELTGNELNDLFFGLWFGLWKRVHPFHGTSIPGLKGSTKYTTIGWSYRQDMAGLYPVAKWTRASEVYILYFSGLCLVLQRVESDST